MSYNRKREKIRRSLSVQRSFEYEKLMKFLRNRYRYEYIDDEQRKTYRFKLPFKYMEKLVAETGRAAIYNHPDYGMAIYKATMAGNLNIYGQPNKYFLYTSNGSKTAAVDADDKNLIIIQDLITGSPLARIAERYGDMLGKIRETIVTNTHAMRTPFIVQAEKEQLLEVNLALEAMNEKPEVIVNKGLNFEDSIKVLELKTPDNLKSLEDEYNTTVGKFMEEVGFATNTIDKKERLVAGEAEDDNEILKAYDSEPYEYRLLFIELMEEKFGIKLKLVKANEDLYIKSSKPEKVEE